MFKEPPDLQLLADAGREPEVVEYLKNPPSAAELDAILRMLGLEPRELMRKGEAIFGELGIDDSLGREEAIRVMVEHPVLIERPIVVDGKKAFIGRPPENVNALL